MGDTAGPGTASVVCDDAPCSREWHRYLYVAQFTDRKSVLELTLGDADGSALFGKAARVVVVDAAGEIRAPGRHHAPNVRVVRGTPGGIPVTEDASFDVVVCFAVDAMDDASRRDFVAEARRLLRRTGILVLGHRARTAGALEARSSSRSAPLADVGRTFRHVTTIVHRPVRGSCIGPADGAPARLTHHRVTDPDARASLGDGEISTLLVCSDGPLALPHSVLDDARSAGADARIANRDARITELENALRLRDQYIAALEHGVERIASAAQAKDAPRGTGDGAGAATTLGGTPVVSIVLAVDGAVEYTRACLEAIARNTTGHHFEVVIVDDGSTDATQDLLRALGGEVQIVRNERPRGLAAACNQGAALAKGRYLVFLHGDAAPQERWLEALVAAAEADEQVGAAVARLVLPDGKMEEAGKIAPPDGALVAIGAGAEAFDPALDIVRDVDAGSRAALLVRRAAFDAVGGFDAACGDGPHADADLGVRLRRHGTRVLYCPRSIVVHFARPGEDDPARREAGRAAFARKWAGEAGGAPESAAAWDGESPPRARVTSVPSGPSVIVVDPLMPVFDRASGSLRLFRILQLMRGLGCRVTYIARDGRGQERYARILQRMGIESYLADPDRMRALGIDPGGRPVQMKPLLGAGRFDVAWLSFFHVAERYVPEIRLYSPRTRIVVDTVDVHFLRELREAELSGSAIAREAASETRRRELRVYGEADTVVTVTEADADVLRRAGVRADLAVVPNLHTPHSGPLPPFAARRGLVFVGNFWHRPNVDAVEWFCSEVWDRVHAALPDAALRVIGANAPDSLRALARPGVEVTGWVESVAPYLDASRVCIAPLRYGAGMKGKIGEALGRGVPVVTTSVGAEGMRLEHGVHALIADDPERFAESVIALHRDEGLWDRLAAAGRSHVDGLCGPAVVRGVLERVLASRDAAPRQVLARAV